MSHRYDIAGLKARLGSICSEDNPALVKQKSRDFFWYSPVLKRQLDQVTADIVVSPTSEAEVLQVLSACHALGIPVTPRGTGTGNYGQAMPLSGGVLLDLSGFNKVKAIHPGRYVAEPGAIMARIDDETRSHSRQELRLHPSTYQTASIGGFIAGGSGGVRIHAHFGDEVLCHLEFVRFDGKVTCFGLPLVRFSSEERLEEIMAIHEEMGAPIFNPHRYTLEEGGMKQTDALQLAFKREADPQGLLNPGKMIAWEDPAYDYRSGKTFLFRSLAQAGVAG